MLGRDASVILLIGEPGPMTTASERPDYSFGLLNSPGQRSGIFFPLAS